MNALEDNPYTSLDGARCGFRGRGRSMIWAVLRAPLHEFLGMISIVRAIVLACALLIVPAAAASATPDPAANSSPLPVPKAQTVVTHHAAHIGNRMISYTATAGMIVLTDAKDEPAASMFYVAYTANGATPTARRAITFAYNGGPGGSSALIHLGAFGPRMVVTTNGAPTPPAPYEIVDNSDSLLDVSDLVFVDAVGTGFSRVVGHGSPKDFYGVEPDGRAFEQFIRRYITLDERWNSPKYLAGESYGTARSAVLANMLQKDGISLSGITLMSTVLDYATIIAQPGNDLPYWLYLPSEAAVAAYHHRLPQAPPDLPAFLAAVRTFAQGPYLGALSKGANLASNERDAIAQELHADTGLPLDYLVRSRLRVPPERFEKQLLSGTDETIGRYDARFHDFDLDPVADAAGHDPTSDAVFGAFTAAFNSYIRSELHYVTDAKYEFLSSDVNRQWQWQRGENGSVTGVNVAHDLRDVLTANPYLRVFSANGIYDLATPFFATEYSLAHLGLDPALQPHITFGYYPSGHMIYLNPAAHSALKADLVKFYR
jgi:carboxypeptidase C (cathepsin A)